MRLNIKLTTNHFCINRVPAPNLLLMILSPENKTEEKEVHLRRWQLGMHQHEIADALSKIFYGGA